MMFVRDLSAHLDSKDMEAANGNVKRFKSYDCKILSLLHSPFTRTALIDSDALFFTDPAPLWKREEMQKTGTFFFRDRHWTNHMGTIGCSNRNSKPLAMVNTTALGKELGANLRPNWQKSHPNLCEHGTQIHEQCSSFVMVDHAHPNAAKAMAMLKKLHTKYILKDHDVKDWGWGDKEYYWIACELAGVECSFTPRGRP